MQHIINSAKTCLKCKRPKCKNACPVSTDIPEMIQKFLNGQIKEAGQMLFENNPLSVICSIVCPHEKHCEGHCVLNKKFSPVNIGGIENYISRYYINYREFKKPKQNGKKIAIIGSGPAGISLAIFMALKGYGITMYEGNNKIGGVLRYGIPDFRIDKALLGTIEKTLIKLGVSIRKNIMIGQNLTIDDLFRDGFNAVFIGTGVWRPKKLNIKGESLGNVHFAIDYLKSPKAYRLGRRVVVIGAGNVAMDVARTAIRSGADDVRIMYRKGEEDMAAEKLEIDHARIDGVKFELFKSPYEFTTKGIKYFDTNDENHEEKFLKADSILVAISQIARDLIVKNNPGLHLDKEGLLQTDENGLTKRKGVFASGDVVTGARTVVEAVAFSKKVAESIEKFLEEKDEENKNGYLND